MAANNEQIGGTHYKQFGDIEPWDVVIAWGLGFLDGNVVKYVARWRSKNGIEDLKKARHYLDKLIEVEEAKIREKQQIDPRMFQNGVSEVYR